MSTKINPKGKDKRVDHSAPRLAGGMGMIPAKQDAPALLRRCVMACMLWEDNAYTSGKSVTEQITALIPQVDPKIVMEMTIEARQKQKLRHTPLFMIVEMTKYPEHRKFLRETIRKVISRADQLTDLLSLYWSEGRRPIPSQMKLGLADAFSKFDEYQFAKYDRNGVIKLRDVLRVCHAKAPQGKEELFKKINERNLDAPDTWEVAFLKGEDKKETWVRLIDENKVGGLAVLKNLKGMTEVGVPESKIRKALKGIRSGFLTPFNFLTAATMAPHFREEIGESMVALYSKLPKLPGLSVIVVDVSGSMGSGVSGKSRFSRMDAGIAMAMLAREQCEYANIYATAGCDGASKHATKRLSNSKGFALLDEMKKAAAVLGGGGIFTRQCLEHIEKEMKGEIPDRIIIFSDSQDCDRMNRIPKPFGTKNYIVDVSCEKHGINYEGIWTAEISGWSEGFLSFISALEGLDVPEAEDESQEAA